MTKEEQTIIEAMEKSGQITNTVYFVRFKDAEKETKLGYTNLAEAWTKYQEYKSIATGIDAFALSHKII
jgi:hypothetical protein